MAEDRNLKPLRNVVLCSTGLTPDQRTELNSKATAMGAVVNMDFTTTTTHLVAEKLNSLKYKFVAKNRLDVKVMDLEWVNHMHSLWVAGDDFDLIAMEQRHKLPTFCGLKICVTSILEEERTKMIKVLESNGAEYHPDLTRKVTHLVSPDTLGKKYHFAKKWKIIIVGPEWVYDSLDRGMVLEERFYDPRLPAESRGEGAKPDPPAAPVAPMNILEHSSSATIANEAAPTAPINPDSSFTKRKIRASAEGKFGSQSNALWGSIMGQANNPKPKKVNEWEESAGDVQFPAAPAYSETAVVEKKRPKQRTGIFADMNFHLLGFSDNEVVKLTEAIQSFDGSVIVSLRTFFSPLELPEKSILLVPPQTPNSQIPRPPAGMDLMIMRYWWLEKCMYTQRFVDPDEFGDGVLYKPSDTIVIDDFKGMHITSTGFSGIELLHVTKVVNLIGAKYTEQLKHHETNLLIRNPQSTTSITGGKLDAADLWKIPIVNLPWLWDSIRQRRKLPIEDYIYKNPTLKRKLSDIRPPVEKRRRPSPPPVPDPEPAGEVEEVRRREEPAEMSAGPSKRRSHAVEANEERERGTKKRSEPATKKGGRLFLEGKRICISRALKDCAEELGDLAESLGAEVVESFEADDFEPITHLIHLSKKANDQTRDYRVAKTIPGVCIVSASWLRKSAKAGKILDEFSFPPLEDGRPTLLLARSHPETPPRKAAVPPKKTVGVLQMGRLPFEQASDSEDEEDIPRSPVEKVRPKPPPPQEIPLPSRHPTPPPPFMPSEPVPAPAPEYELEPELSPPRFKDYVPARSISPANPPPNHMVSDLFNKLKPEALSSLLAAPAQRPRRRGLTGRALSTLSANSSGRTTTNSQVSNKKDSQDADASMELDNELPESTQSRVIYADKAESVLERRKVLEKVGAKIETPVVRKAAAGAIVVGEARDLIRRRNGNGRRRGAAYAR